MEGTLSPDTAGVRRVQILWPVSEAPSPDNSDMYSLTVTDANGTVTGKVAGTVTYTESMPAGQGCGTAWNATLSD